MVLATHAPGFTVVEDRLLYAGARMDASRIEHWLDYTMRAVRPDPAERVELRELSA